MSTVLEVSAIKQGTVIDHIPAGKALEIVRLLNVLPTGYQITLGLNLKSTRGILKDIIKLENILLNTLEKQKVAIIAPKATINSIENYEVLKKETITVPNEIREFFKCPNTQCVTHSESINSYFKVAQGRKGIILHCVYCEQAFIEAWVKRTTA